MAVAIPPGGWTAVALWKPACWHSLLHVCDVLHDYIMCIYIYIYIYVYTMYIYIYIYTHTYTYTSTDADN